MVFNRIIIASIVFVIIWSTGFIVARGIVDHADPSIFLTIRFALCVTMFGAIALALKAPWPEQSAFIKLLGIGALLQGVYLGAGFWAVGNGLQPGLMALICALQPPLTAWFAHRYFGEKLNKQVVIGLVIAFCGTALAVAPPQSATQIPFIVIFAGLVSIGGITAGTLLQRTSVHKVDLFVASSIQNIGAVLVALTLTIVLSEYRFHINTTSLLLLAYAVLVLSLGGATLLIWLVRNGNMTQTTSLFFVVPPMAAGLGYLFFGDTLTPVQIAGFVIALAGVWLAQKRIT